MLGDRLPNLDYSRLVAASKRIKPADQRESGKCSSAGFGIA
jgi:hypothetical protein